MDNQCSLFDAVASLLHKLEPINFSNLKIPPDLVHHLTKLKDALPFLLEPWHIDNISLSLDDLNVLKNSVCWADDLLGSNNDFEDDKKALQELRLITSRLVPLFESSSSDLLSKITEIRQITESQLPDIVQQFPPYLFRLILHCSIYPKGHRFLRETLIYMWMAQDLLEEDAGYLYFEELLLRGIFQKLVFVFGNGSSRRVYSCEMNPVAHDAARRLAADELAVLDTRYPDGYSSAAVGQRAQHVAFHNNGFSQVNLEKVIQNCSNATTLMSSSAQWDMLLGGSKGQIVSWGAFSQLHVLDLPGCPFKKLPSVSLSSLRYLNMSRNVVLESFSCSLFPSLETLAIDGCVQLKLDQGLYSLKYLKNLYLTTREKRLDLHGLSMLEISHCEHLMWLIDIFTVKILRIFECPKLPYLPKVASLEELVLHNCARLSLDVGWEKWTSYNLKRLELVGLQMGRLPDWLQFAQALKYFMIADCPQLKQMRIVQYLGSLQELYIYNCPKLQFLPDIEFYSLSNLRLFDVRNCPNFTGKSTRLSKIQENFGDIPSTETKKSSSQIAPNLIGLQKSLLSLPNPSDIDGQIQNQKYSISQEPDAQIASHVNQSDPYFLVKSQMNRIGMLIDYNHWRTLALVFKAIMRMKIIVRVNPGRELTKLHCCLFPNDYEFERETLVQLWMAVGYLGENGAKSMESAGNRRFDTLLEEQYILPARVDILTGRSKYKFNFDMVTTLLNGMQTIQNKDLHAMLEHENASVVGSKFWHVSIMSNHIDQGTFETLKTFNELRTLLFARNYGSSLKQISSDLFLAVKSLQALDLSGSHITELPSSIGNVTQLRYLDLSFT